MNAKNTTAARYIDSAKFPIRFDKLHAGSLFKIAAEPSRKITKSRDARVYRRAQDHEGFYATLEGDKSKAIVLMPFDMVQPVRKEKV